MDSPSILNDVLGPVMRGPSSSHTAGSYHIGRTLRDLAGGDPRRAAFVFDPGGSYARTYTQQGVDLALATGLLGRKITDRGFAKSLSAAKRRGIAVSFRIARLADADHPNTVEIRLIDRGGRKLEATAKSTGGGSFLVSRLDGWPAAIDGKAHQVFVFAARKALPALRFALTSSLAGSGKLHVQSRGAEVLVSLRLIDPPGPVVLSRLASVPGVTAVRAAHPVFLVPRGPALFESAEGLLRLAARRHWTMGEAAEAYEAKLLGIPEDGVVEIMRERFDVMKESVEAGLRRQGVRMQLLRPSAGKVWASEQAGRVAAGGLHARAAARALAVLHVSNSMGTVCAAPTGGSAGVVPAVCVTMAEEWKLEPRAMVRALFAAGAVGLILAKRATFAAEVAGCQVEIGAAGAMAAAAVVEAAGGGARQAADAAAIAFQNTMGSVCDLVQGMCEIPCHTRNAVAASSAFVCADLVMGGYVNPVPLDETIDAVYDCGKMLPAELRCTAAGGLALAPSAMKLPNLRKRRRT